RRKYEPHLTGRTEAFGMRRPEAGAGLAPRDSTQHVLVKEAVLATCFRHLRSPPGHLSPSSVLSVCSMRCAGSKRTRGGSCNDDCRKTQQVCNNGKYLHIAGLSQGPGE